jgi:hypothetical protein
MQPNEWTGGRGPESAPEWTLIWSLSPFAQPWVFDHPPTQADIEARDPGQLVADQHQFGNVTLVVGQRVAAPVQCPVGVDVEVCQLTPTKVPEHLRFDSSPVKVPPMKHESLFSRWPRRRCEDLARARLIALIRRWIASRSIRK